MPLPVAHALLGASVVAALHPKISFKQEWRGLLLGASLAVCPDLDYSLNYLPGLGTGWHHGFTHSFAFALLCGATAALLLGKFSPRNVIIFFLATASHPVLDFLFTDSRGIELLWPFSGTKFRVEWPNPINYEWSTFSRWSTAADILEISASELVIYGLIFVAAYWFSQTETRNRLSP